MHWGHALHCPAADAYDNSSVRSRFVVLSVGLTRVYCAQNDPPRDADTDSDAVQLAPQNVHINLRPSNIV